MLSAAAKEAKGTPAPRTEQAEWARQQRIRRGKARPEDLEPLEDADDPVVTSFEDLTEGQRWIWGMFDRLSRARGFNEGGAQPIRYAEIAAYFDILGVADEQLRTELADVLCDMDVLWMTRHREKQKAELESLAEERERKLKAQR